MKNINFKTVSTFLGRNGEFKSTGLVLSLSLSNEVFIQPITSKGTIGRAYIAIPNENIQELIEALILLVPRKSDKIVEIKRIIATWGVVQTNELTFCESSPCISSTGNGKNNVSQLVEEFRLDYVKAITYHDELAIQEEMIDYEDLSDELIDEVHAILKKHDELMLEK